MRALDERTVKIDATPFPGDPWAEALQAAGTKLGVIAIDLAEPLGGLAENRPHHLVRESVRGYSYLLHQGRPRFLWAGPSEAATSCLS